MLLLRCTTKLLKEMGIPRLKISSDVQSDDPLGSWYANIILIDRRKCIIFVNEKTLFSFLVPGIKKSDLKNIKELFLENLRINLNFISLPQKAIEKIVEPYLATQICKTSDKSVLGSMTDYIRNYKYLVYYEDGKLVADILKVNADMNQMPMGMIGYSNGETMLMNALFDMAT